MTLTPAQIGSDVVVVVALVQRAAAHRHAPNLAAVDVEDVAAIHGDQQRCGGGRGVRPGPHLAEQEPAVLLVQPRISAQIVQARAIWVDDLTPESMSVTPLGRRLSPGLLAARCWATCTECSRKSRLGRRFAPPGTLVCATRHRATLWAWAVRAAYRHGAGERAAAGVHRSTKVGRVLEPCAPGEAARASTKERRAQGPVRLFPRWGAPIGRRQPAAPRTDRVDILYVHDLLATAQPVTRRGGPSRPAAAAGGRWTIFAARDRSMRLGSASTSSWRRA